MFTYSRNMERDTKVDIDQGRLVLNFKTLSAILMFVFLAGGQFLFVKVQLDTLNDKLASALKDQTELRSEIKGLQSAIQKLDRFEVRMEYMERNLQKSNETLERIESFITKKP